MISSGIKRGLAGSAVAALAVTGLPFLASSASANSMAEQAGTPDQVVLHTPSDLGTASIKNDGDNTSVHLVANGGANVVQVRFEYFGLDAAWHTIATVGRSNGVFSTEWTPAPALYNTSVPLRATGVNNIGTDIAGADTNTPLVSASAEAIDIANAAGSAVGVFHQPYAGPNNKDLGAVSGTTSDLAGNPGITVSSPSGTGGTMAEDYAETVAAGDTVRDWSAPVDFSGYVWDADPSNGTVDQALVIAKDASEDGEAVSLYKQTISDVSAVAKNPTVAAGGSSSVTVTVTDQNGKPVAGAEVGQDTNSDGTAETLKYTDSRGTATFTQTGATSPNTDDYFVNTTGVATYENGTDFKRSVTVSEYTPAAATVTPSSADGAAFDFDENAASDIQVTVKDQNGNPMNGQVVRYAWTVTPFTATAGYPKTLPEGSATTGVDGKADITFPAGQPSGTYTLHTYINQDGTPGQGPGDLNGTDLTVKAGQADVKWADGSVAQAQSNTTKTFTGELVLEDGTTVLAGRTIAISWVPTVGGNAVVAAQASQPTGTTRTGDGSATTTTGSDGSFGVALTDPPAVTPPGPQNEKGGQLTATTTNTPNIGNAGDSSTLTVDFLKSIAPAQPSDITVSQQDLIDAMATPGRPVDLDITVKNADGDTLTDYPVTVSVDHGFLSPNAESAAALKADPDPAQDGLYGEWKSDGTSKDLTTDDSGITGAVVAIEKDAAFQTSQDVTTTVTIKAGDVTKTVPVTFTSKDPLNGGEVKIERDATQTVSVLPKAPITETVFYDLFVTDQFGNLVDNVPVAVSDDSATATFAPASPVNSQLEGEGAALTLSATAAGDQTLTGTWTAPTNTWNDNVPATPAFDAVRKTGTKTVTGKSETVNWYAIDYAASTYALTHTGAESQPVGTTVTMTYKAVDQNGEPLTGYDVVFFRTGPDDLQDGDGNSVSTTNANGEATYVFQGAKAGTATVTAVLHAPDGNPNQVNGNLIPQGEQTDTVMFEGPVTPPADINLKAKGKNNGKKDDVLTANANNNAAGLVAKVFVHGKKVASHKLNSHGNFKFKLDDKNGKKVTKYVVKVAKTDTTNADQASKKLK